MTLGPRPRISHISYRGTTSGEPDEYIEIVNDGDAPADLSGWTVKSQGVALLGKNALVFPPGTVLAPQARLRVTTNDPSSPFRFGNKRALWNNTGDVGELLDPSNNLVDAWRYFQPTSDIVVTTGSPPRHEIDPYDFGRQRAGTEGGPVTFTIENRSADDVHLTGTPLVAVTNGAFEIVGQPPAVVPYKGSVTFTARFRPGAIGPQEAEVSILHAFKKKPGSAYTFRVKGEGTGRAKLDVTSSLPLDGLDRAFGERDVGGRHEGTLTLTNTGDADLVFKAPAASVTGDASITIEPIPDGEVLAPGESLTVKVVFEPRSGGEKIVDWHLAYADGTGDQAETVQITGKGIGPEIDLRCGGASIAAGAWSHAFGAHNVGSASGAVAFTIDNQGNRDLRLDGSPRVVVTGADAADFRVERQPDSPIAPGGSATFTIVFTPGAPGPRRAKVSIASNDADENPYTFDVTGEGVARRVVATGGPIAILRFSIGLARRPDGTVWQRPSSGGWRPIPGVTDVQAIAAPIKHNSTAAHGYAIKNDGGLWTLEPSGRPARKLLDGIVSVAAGFDHVLALREDGAVLAQGASTFGQAGGGAPGPGGFAEVGLTGVKAIAAGYFSSVALRHDGTVWCWGIASPSGSGARSPSQIRNLSGIAAIAAANNNAAGFCLAASHGGDVYGWTGAYDAGAHLCRVGGSPRVLAGDGGQGAQAHNVYVVTADGALWSYGMGQRGQLGRGGPARFLPAGVVPGLPAIASVCCSWTWTMALDVSGGIWEWGTMDPYRRVFATPQRTL